MAGRSGCIPPESRGLDSLILLCFMKQRLSITVEADLIPVAKRYARSKGVSLSALIEESLREITQDAAETFSRRWRGKFREAERDDPRCQALARKYPG